jgi:hypothetical protein
LKKKAPKKKVTNEEARQAAWRADFEIARLQNWAKRVESVPMPSEHYKKFGRLPDVALSDLERIGLAAYLRRVADNPEAIAVLVGNPLPEKKRGVKASRKVVARNYHVALDFRLTRRRIGRKVWPLSEVWAAWNISRSQVMAAHVNLEKLDYFRRWAALWLRTFRAKHPSLHGLELRTALSRNLRESGKILPE